MKYLTLIFAAAALILPAAADPFIFSTNAPDGLMAIASRPSSAGKIEIEGADDFLLTTETLLNSATFTGLLTNATPSDINQVVVEIYRVFPNDSDVGRTSGPPTFSTSQVPTRVNSPSDVAFDSRDSGVGSLNFSTVILNPLFSVANTVTPGGIHPFPGQTTGGNGPGRGTEVQFNITFTTPFDLPAGHYFFIPQVGVSPADGEFLWLSAPRPIVAPGTPFLPDLQSWTRDANLDPDWLRVGTDIVGSGTFNQAFSLDGTTVPEPTTIGLVAAGIAAVGVFCRKRRVSKS